MSHPIRDGIFAHLYENKQGVTLSDLTKAVLYHDNISNRVQISEVIAQMVSEGAVRRYTSPTAVLGTYRLTDAGRKAFLGYEEDQDTSTEAKSDTDFKPHIVVRKDAKGGFFQASQRPHVHPNRFEAVKEAERLARGNTGHEFYVFEAVSKTVHSGVRTEAV